MCYSLINSNQCRSFGISMCDDPTDKHRKIVMELPDNYFLPFRMRGTTCYFQSRSPEVHELETCRTFQVSDANFWNPADEMFISTVERGQVCASDLFDVCASELCSYEFDLLQGSPTHIMAQIRTSDRHHGVDAILLSLKWGIGLRRQRRH